jgi:hypothetical protein
LQQHFYLHTTILWFNGYVTITKHRAQYIKRPGMKAAAKKLGCTYHHLRRVAIGAVKSPALFARYKALQNQSPANPLTP